MTRLIDIKRPLALAAYTPTPEFLSIPKHMAIGFEAGRDSVDLVACVGTYDNDAVDESLAYGRLFCASPDMLDVLEQIVQVYHGRHEFENERAYTIAMSSLIRRAHQVVQTATGGAA